MKRILKRRVLIPVFIIVFGLIQFKTIDKVNMVVPAEFGILTIETPPKEVGELISAACFDCHSNTTKYPWYSNIAPVSWWMKKHVEKGREKLNFSKWSDYSEEKRDSLRLKSAELIEKKWMPIISYKIIHPEAQLDEYQRELLISWMKK